jgi:tRNA(fMet)-specific endonuclease VapC
MKYLLDANTCIDHFRLGAASAVTGRILAAPRTSIALCSVVRGELLVGALKSTNPAAAGAKLRRFTASFPSLPFDDAAADRYADTRAHLEKLGTPIGPNDLLIAAIGLANGLIVVTNNTGEFSRVPNLALEDWTRP